MTAALVSGRMPSRALIALDTVIGDTPTFAATSLIVARRPRRPGSFNDALPFRSEGLLDFFGAGTSRSFRRYECVGASPRVSPARLRDSLPLGRLRGLGKWVPAQRGMPGPWGVPASSQELRIRLVARQPFRQSPLLDRHPLYPVTESGGVVPAHAVMETKRRIEEPGDPRIGREQRSPRVEDVRHVQ